MCAGPFLRYVKGVLRGVLEASPPRTSAAQVTKTIGQSWRELSPEQKQHYVAAHRADAAAQRRRAADSARAVILTQQQGLRQQYEGKLHLREQLRNRALQHTEAAACSPHPRPVAAVASAASLPVLSGSPSGAQVSAANSKHQDAREGGRRSSQEMPGAGLTGKGPKRPRKSASSAEKLEQYKPARGGVHRKVMGWLSKTDVSYW